MPITVCRCCGGRLESEPRAANPNICVSCEQLLEDDSPALMARIARMKRQPDLDKLLDQPDKPASRKTAKGKKHQPT